MERPRPVRTHVLLASLSIVLLWLIIPVGRAAGATVAVDVGNFFFDDASGQASEITGVAGDTIRFTVSGGQHNLNIDALNVHSATLKTNESANLIINQVGTFTLYCSVHNNNAHTTTLRVTAASSPPPTSGGDGNGGGGTSTTKPATVPGGGGSSGSGGTPTTGSAGAATGSGSATAPVAGGADAASGTGGSGTATTNASGQRVTAEGEVIASPLEAGDPTGAGASAAPDGNERAATLEAFAADGSPLTAVSESDSNLWVGLGGIVLVVGGLLVLVRPRKRTEPDDDDGVVVFSDSPDADGDNG